MRCEAFTEAMRYMAVSEYNFPKLRAVSFSDITAQILTEGIRHVRSPPSIFVIMQAIAWRLTYLIWPLLLLSAHGLSRVQHMPTIERPFVFIHLV